ncbi:MAG TPA: NAD(P)-binding domain-containing protein [Acidiferrobacterales bacterium]|nr:NAD(P)-binding domain-containing protein [Acidiferrobacterales bacterium]
MGGDRFRVLILGYGEMGHAMTHLLHHRHEVCIWQRRPQDGSPPIELAHTAPHSDFIIFCVPAQPHFDLAMRLRPVLSRDTICISIAKGLDDVGRPVARIFQQVFADQIPFGLLHGPMIAEEILTDKPAFAQLGVSDAEVFARTARLFAGTLLFIEYTADRLGISWAAALKNVYAMLFGIADELALGDNLRGYLAVAAMREMDQIITALAKQSGAACQLAGLGDLLTTATSADSHHHELGRRIARGAEGELQGEGIHTLHMVEKFSLFPAIQYPLYHFMQSSLRDPVSLREKLLAYLDAVYLRHSERSDEGVRLPVILR